MLFMISYQFDAHDRDVVQDRFKKTGGRPGPGATMLNRWHDVGGNRGFVLAESDDSVAVGKWMHDWSDYLEFEVIPVLTDEDVMKVLGG